MERVADPTFQRHQLRQQLRRLRDAAELSRRQVADELGWSESKLLRLESGQVGVSTTDLRALLGLYGVNDPKEQSGLLRLAKESRRQPWGEYRDVLHSEYLVYLRYESVASRIRVFHPDVVPGLLQTEAYARSLIWAVAPAGTPERTLQRQLEARLARQRLLRQEAGPDVAVILEEAALRRYPRRGSEGESILMEQWRHLNELARLPHITIKVLPYTHGFHSNTCGSFVLLDLASRDRIVYLERTRSASAIRDEPDQVAYYDRSFDELAHAAAAPEAFTRT